MTGHKNATENTWGEKTHHGLLYYFVREFCQNPNENKDFHFSPASLLHLSCFYNRKTKLLYFTSCLFSAGLVFPPLGGTLTQTSKKILIGYHVGRKCVQMFMVSLFMEKLLRTQSRAELRGWRYPDMMPSSLNTWGSREQSHCYIVHKWLHIIL